MSARRSVHTVCFICLRCAMSRRPSRLRPLQPPPRLLMLSLLLCVAMPDAGTHDAAIASRQLLNGSGFPRQQRRVVKLSEEFTG